MRRKWLLSLLWIWLLFPLTQNSERLNDLLKVTQLINCGAGKPKQSGFRVWALTLWLSKTDGDQWAVWAIADRVTEKMLHKYLNEREKSFHFLGCYLLLNLAIVFSPVSGCSRFSADINCISVLLLARHVTSPAHLGKARLTAISTLSSLRLKRAKTDI